MNALDTNVLVRFLVQDDSQQVKIVNRLITNAEEEKQPIFVTLLVVLELIWVLESVYSVTRADILSSLSNLLSMPALEFEKQAVLRLFLASASNSNFDLADLLIAHSGIHSGVKTTLTFDKGAAKSEFFKVL